MASRFDLRLPRGRTLSLPSPEEMGRPRVMGILNITPDSFSDGGRWLDPERAIEHGLRMLDQGADLLDLGAESTRPGGGVYGDGARTLTPNEEIDRLLPVLSGLRQATDAPLSVDTRKGAVARQALREGADLINDVAGLQDPELVAAVGEADVPVIIMHSRGDLSSMQRHIQFDDVAAEVVDELRQRGEVARRGGVAVDQLVFDPGIGFGKTASQNLRLLGRCDLLHGLARPLLVGASRKSFIASLHPAPPEERLAGSLAAVAWAVQQGVAMVRVHDIEETMQFLNVWNAIHLAAHDDAGRQITTPT